jgi:hypothetical protein
MKKLFVSISYIFILSSLISDNISGEEDENVSEHIAFLTGSYL